MTARYGRERPSSGHSAAGFSLWDSVIGDGCSVINGLLLAAGMVGEITSRSGGIMKLYLVAASALTLGSPANAATIFSDNFDGEGGGATINNYTGFANFAVIDGSVDLLRQPNSDGLSCAGGVGSSCVDLDGSTGAGGILQSGLFAFQGGATVTLSFDIAGNQRNEDYDGWFGFIAFTTPVDLSNLGLNYYGSPQDHGPFINPGSFGAAGFTYGNEPFQRRSLYFTAVQAGEFFFQIGTLSDDNEGPLLDNVTLDIASSAVPEPATWAMMIGGFMLVGGALRRRKVAVCFA
jgi:hypothetical protein